MLLLTWLEVFQEQDDWYEVQPHPNRGDGRWVRKSYTRTTPVLKMFFVDDGQGDALLAESPKDGVVVDGGPNKNLYRFLRHRYRPIFQSGDSVHIDLLVMSHPDYDHHNGLTWILVDSDFTIILPSAVVFESIPGLGCSQRTGGEYAPANSMPAKMGTW